MKKRPFLSDAVLAKMQLFFIFAITTALVVKQTLNGLNLDVEVFYHSPPSTLLSVTSCEFWFNDPVTIVVCSLITVLFCVSWMFAFKLRNVGNEYSETSEFLKVSAVFATCLGLGFPLQVYLWKFGAWDVSIVIGMMFLGVLPLLIMIMFFQSKITRFFWPSEEPKGSERYISHTRVLSTYTSSKSRAGSSTNLSSPKVTLNSGPAQTKSISRFVSKSRSGTTSDPAGSPPISPKGATNGINRIEMYEGKHTATDSSDYSPRKGRTSKRSVKMTQLNLDADTTRLSTKKKAYQNLSLDTAGDTNNILTDAMQEIETAYVVNPALDATADVPDSKPSRTSTNSRLIPAQCNVSV